MIFDKFIKNIHVHASPSSRSAYTLDIQQLVIRNTYYLIHDGHF